MSWLPEMRDAELASHVITKNLIWWYPISTWICAVFKEYLKNIQAYNNAQTLWLPTMQHYTNNNAEIFLKRYKVRLSPVKEAFIITPTGKCSNGSLNKRTSIHLLLTCEGSLSFQFCVGGWGKGVECVCALKEKLLLLYIDVTSMQMLHYFYYRSYG